MKPFNILYRKLLESIQAHTTATGNPHGLSRSDIDAQQTLTSGVNIKTLNNTSLLGTGNIDVSGGSTNGWVPAPSTPVYASADSPSFVMAFSGDLTSTISPGMRVKLTQTTGGTKYFIVTHSAYDSTNTNVTMYGGTDYSLVNEAITNAYFSTHKAPTGFPLSRSKWTISAVSSNSDALQASVTTDTWYNLGSLSFSLPVGEWVTTFSVIISATRSKSSSTSASGTNTFATISTANNSESSTANTVFDSPAAISGLTSGTYGDTGYGHLIRSMILSATAKTTYYVNAKASSGDTITNLRFRGDIAPTTVSLLCSYL